MSQIFLFTGENEYELSREKSRWIGEFCKKHGAENIARMEAKSLKITALLDEVSVAPFIAEKRLIVVEGIPKFEKGQIQQIDTQIHPGNLLLFVESKPDKRLTSTKELMNCATVKMFNPLRHDALKAWLMARAQSLGSSLGPKAADHLLQMVGDDQMLLSTEIQKLATCAGDTEITIEQMNDLVMLTEQQASWKLMDLLAARKEKEALRFIQELLQKGESPHALWNRLLWVASQITLVAASCQEGDNAPASIAKSTGVPFPTARTLQPFLRGVGTDSIRMMVDTLADADKQLKTGGYRSTNDAPEELTALIDHCVVLIATL